MIRRSTFGGGMDSAAHSDDGTGERELPVPGDAAARAGRSEVLTWLRRDGRAGEVQREETGETIAAWLRGKLCEGLHAGHLRAGDRLPSIREISSALETTAYAAADAYARLESLGLVEKRDRSGVYVAAIVPEPDPPAAETLQWMVEVLGQAVEHRLKIPQLPDLIHRWALARVLCCACVESVEDARVALCQELEEIYGLRTEAIRLEALPHVDVAQTISRSQVPREVQEADVLVTTSYHAAELRPVAAALGKPLVASVVHPEIVAAIEGHLERRGELTFICADAGFGERLRSGIRGGAYRDRIHVVLADDADAIAAVDRSEPVYLTRAARRHLGPRADFRLVVRPTPTFSPAFTRSLLRVILDSNLCSAGLQPG